MDPYLATQLNAECGIHSDPDPHPCLGGTVMYDTVKLNYVVIWDALGERV